MKLTTKQFSNPILQKVSANVIYIMCEISKQLNDTQSLATSITIFGNIFQKTKVLSEKTDQIGNELK